MAKPIFSDEELMADMERRFCERNRFVCPEQMVYYMTFLLWKASTDTAYVVLLNRSKYHIRSIRLTEGALHKVNLFSEEIRKQMDSAYSFFIGHTHGSYPVTPSPEDLHTGRILAMRFPDRPKYLGQVIVNHRMQSTYIQP
ncbi:MAG: hypothetical protein II979_05590 [Clostridia bacterium]|nr:hypothetical protein [Clostridia bacterium]